MISRCYGREHFRGRSRCVGALNLRPRLDIVGASASFDHRDLRARDGRKSRDDRALQRGRSGGQCDETRRSPFHGAGAVQGAPFRRLCGQARKARSCSIRRRRADTYPQPTRKILPSRRASSSWKTRTSWPKSPALSEWPVTLMGSFENGFPGDPRRGDPRHHPQQPEMLRAATRQTAKLVKQSLFLSPMKRPRMVAGRLSPATSG